MIDVCLLSQRWERGGRFPGGSKEDLPEHSGRQSGSERGRIGRAAQTVSAAGRPAHQRTTAAEGRVWLLMTIVLYCPPQPSRPLPPPPHHHHTRPSLGSSEGCGGEVSRLHALVSSYLSLHLSIFTFLLSVFLFSHHPLTNRCSSLDTSV